MISRDFRDEARRKLEGKWGKVALITLAYMVVFFVLGFIEGLLAEGSLLQSIFSIAVAIIEVPLAFGMIIALFKVYNSEDVKAFDFFSLGFKNFSKSWGITFQMILKLIVPIILIIVSLILIVAIGMGSLIFASANSALTPSEAVAAAGSGLVGFIGFILYIVAVVWVIMKSYYYSMSFIIAADDENLTSKEVVEKSKELMTGKRGKLFCLQFSFIGWAILASFTFGIGLLWLIPYVQFAIFAFYYFIANKSNVDTSKVEESPINSNDNDSDSLN